MGTRWEARFVAPRGFDTDRLNAAIVGELDAVIAGMSHWEAGSAISRFNAAPAGRWLTLPPALFHVVQAGVTLAEETDGAFDPAVGALADLWGFGPTPAAALPPADADIAAARASGGWQRLDLDRHARRARQPGGLRFDLSGIAKGHAVDRVAAVLAAHGLRDALVEIGGELRGSGLRPDGQPWWVAVEMPPGASLPPIRVALHGLAIATSGDYRRWFAHDGRRYAHTLDPRNGRPLDNGVASVTVLHAECMMADALATAIGVMGPAAGIEYATAAGVAALMILRGGQVHEERMSPAFATMLG